METLSIPKLTSWTYTSNISISPKPSNLQLANKWGIWTYNGNQQLVANTKYSWTIFGWILIMRWEFVQAVQI